MSITRSAASTSSTRAARREIQTRSSMASPAYAPTPTDRGGRAGPAPGRLSAGRNCYGYGREAVRHAQPLRPAQRPEQHERAPDDGVLGNRRRRDVVGTQVLLM